MGMSSSQARLLTLTSRLHSIEISAQKIEAEKLRLANDSNRVYENYLNKIEATKLQYSTLQADGTLTYKDATLNAMENGIIGNWGGETSNDVLFMQTQEGKILLTPAVAQKYGLTSTATENRDLDTFVKDTTGKDKASRDIMKKEPVYRDEKHMVDVEVDDPTKVLDFTKVANNTTSTPVRPTNFAPVKNTSALANAEYDTFQTVVNKINTTGVQEITSATTSLSAGGTYKISTAEGLIKLATLANASNTAGSTIILANDIDMSGKSWSGISNFAGTFNGNGYVIKNLGQNGGTATNGLIVKTLSSATIKNVGLENVNIQGKGNDIAGFVGTLSNNSTITNCYITGSISTKQDPTNNGYHIGGFVGNNLGGTISNCNANVEVSGYGCTGGISGHNSGIIQNCNITGTVYSCFNYENGNTSSDKKYTSWVGGICGHNEGITTIKDCVTTTKIEYKNDGTHDPSNPSYTNGTPGGIVIGQNDDPTKLTISNITYDPNLNPGINITNSGDFGTTGAFKQQVNPPSINTTDYTGGFYSNILGALVKAGVDYDTLNKDTVKNYVSNLYNSTDGNYKIANINEYLYNYLTNADTTGGNFITALQNDITNGTTTNTTDSIYQDIYTSSNSNIIMNTTNTSDSWEPFGAIQKGNVTIPSVDNIGTQLYYALKKAGIEADETTVKNWVQNKYNTSNADDKMFLANLNNDIQSATNLAVIKSAIDNNTKYENSTNYSVDEYDITLAGNRTITPTYAKKTEQQWDGTYDKVVDHYEDVVDYTEKYWDTTDPDIANAIAMYAMAKRGVTVVTDEQASSYTWLVNMANSGEAVFTTFDPSKVEKLANMTATEINNMTEEEYNDLMGIKNTSVSVETSMMEVKDEKNVKKAEAEYEADMKKIDNKDRQYDTELAACETERNAIKEEVDTLKTVAKENVDRTFKLFS